MNRSADDILILRKTDQVIKEQLPSFTSRYFNHHMERMAPRTLYSYALDLVIFFDYLKSISFDVDKMSIRDLETVTPQIIEDFLVYSNICNKNGNMTKTSPSTVARRYSSLSSFFKYYYKQDLIDQNPVSKIARPKPKNRVSSIPSNTTNLEMLDFVVNGELGGRRDDYREITKDRDIAIILLIMGAGIKGSDVVNLDVDNLHLEDKYITVRSRKTTRTVYISDMIAQALSKYLSQRIYIIPEYGSDNALFLSLHCRRICLRSIQKMVKKYSSAMFDQRDHLTPSALRQSFRNNVFSQTKNISITSAASGDNNNYVLKRYRAYLEEYECKKGSEF